MCTDRISLNHKKREKQRGTPKCTSLFWLPRCAVSTDMDIEPTTPCNNNKCHHGVVTFGRISEVKSLVFPSDIVVRRAGTLPLNH